MCEVNGVLSGFYGGLLKWHYKSNKKRKGESCAKIIEDKKNGLYARIQVKSDLSVKKENSRKRYSSTRSWRNNVYPIYPKSSEETKESTSERLANASSKNVTVHKGYKHSVSTISARSRSNYERDRFSNVKYEYSPMSSDLIEDKEFLDSSLWIMKSQADKQKEIENFVLEVAQRNLNKKKSKKIESTQNVPKDVELGSKKGEWKEQENGEKYEEKRYEEEKYEKGRYEAEKHGVEKHKEEKHEEEKHEEEKHAKEKHAKEKQADGKHGEEKHEEEKHEEEKHAEAKYAKEKYADGKHVEKKHEEDEHEEAKREKEKREKEKREKEKHEEEKHEKEKREKEKREKEKHEEEKREKEKHADGKHGEEKHKEEKNVEEKHEKEKHGEDKHEEEKHEEEEEREEEKCEEEVIKIEIHEASRIASGVSINNNEITERRSRLSILPRIGAAQVRPSIQAFSDMYLKKDGK